MKLILFDIDGTLVWPDGAGRAAMQRALAEVCGTAGPADALPMAGKTDWQIVTELLTEAKLHPSIIEGNRLACFQAVARHMIKTTHERNIRVCPGVPLLLDQLSCKPNFILGLLTGNLHTTAPIKLRAAKLNPALFRVGAYGDDGLERSQLPDVAIARAQILTRRVFREKDVVIIGDTPADVTCGRHLSVMAIGVTTGHYSAAELVAAGADFVFPDLTDTNTVVQAISS